MTDAKIPPGHRLNKLGHLVKTHETLDPVPKASSVKFKRPLSAHERVLQALRTHDRLKALDALPGDESLDSPDVESMTPHQLMTDPTTGAEMTAGEYVMLQTERAQASKDIANARNTALKRRNQKKLVAPTEPNPKSKESEESDD